MIRAWLGVAASLVFVASACGDDKPGGVVDARSGDDGSSDHDAAQDGTPKDPNHLELAGHANGMLWDNTAKLLYFTDATAGKLMTYTDAGGVQVAGDLPAVAQGLDPGAIAVVGTNLISPNFHAGDSPANQLLLIDPTGVKTKLTSGLPTANHRLGVAVQGGVLYDAFFTGTAQTAAGSIAKLTVDATSGVATETPITFAVDPGFAELVGLVATNNALFVADNTSKKIVKVVVTGTAGVATDVGTVTDAGPISIMPNGDVIVGGSGVHRLTQAGVETQLFATEAFGAVRGSAYDPTGKRLFFISGGTSPTDKEHLEIRALAE